MRTCRNRPSWRIGIGRAVAVCSGVGWPRIGWPEFRHAVFVLLTGLLLTPIAAHGGFWESFEGPLPTWRVVGGDVRYQLTRHERVDSPVHSGAWSEVMTVQAGGGTYLHAAFDISPVALIDELEAGLWVRSERPGMQLIARVVLPRSIDPKTGKPVTLLLHGSIYHATGRWQRLELNNFPTAMARQVRIARSDNIARAIDEQQPYDTREAYIDQIRLNIFGGRGTTTVVIDDFEINGYVEVEKRGEVAQRGGDGNLVRTAHATEPISGDRNTGAHPPGVQTAIHRTPEGRRESRIARVAWESSILAAEGKPLLPRIIQYHGEPLAHLRSLGFNAVWLDDPPTTTLLQEALTAGMWLVCPAPSLDTPPFEQPLVPILSWHVGRDLSRRDLRTTAERVQHLRRIDGSARRPICAQVTSNVDAFSRHVDVLLLDRKWIGTSLDRDGYFRWLSLSTQMARPGATFWAMLHSRSPDGFAKQATALGLERSLEPVADWQQLRTMALGAIAHGVRGLMFASHSRLDARDPQTKRRAAQLELLNLELSLIEPWAAAGRFVTTVESNNPNIKAYVLQSDHTRLVLPILSDAPPQQALRPVAFSRVASTSLRFTVPGVPDANRAYELTLGGLRPLNSLRVAGGKSVSLDIGATGSLIVLTSDPRVTGQMNGRIAKIRERAAELTYAVAASLAADTDATLRASARIPAAVVQTPLAAAARHLKKSRDLTQRGDHHGGLRSAHAALQAVDAARVAARPHFGLLRHPNTTFSFPLDDRFDTLPAQATTSLRLAHARWNRNQLAGGNCEDLTQMMQAGWQHVEFPQQGLTTTVELSANFPHSGRTSLHLVATPAAGSSTPRLVESPPVWIGSAAVPANAGDIVRIQGAVRVPRPPQGSVDKLLIIDSIGGKELALRMGAADGWQNFVIYRAAPQAGNVSVTFALSGVGEAWVDDVTIQTVDQLPPLPTGPPAASPRPSSLVPPSSPRPPSSPLQSPVAGPTDPFAGVPLH